MPKWTINSDACNNICGVGSTCPTGPQGPAGASGSQGPTGPAGSGAQGLSVSWIAGNTGPYVNTTTNTIGTGATRLYEVPFNVSSTSDKFLIHYNIVLDSSVNNHEITSTLGLATSISASAASSTNLQTGTVGVTLTGASSDKYIAASHGNVNGTDAVNLCGFGTITNLTAVPHYITVWAAASGSTTLTTPVVNVVILKTN